MHAAADLAGSRRPMRGQELLSMVSLLATALTVFGAAVTCTIQARVSSRVVDSHC